MRPNPVLLSRGQFAWVIAWHILLPTFTIGLASFLAVLEGMFLILIGSRFADATANIMSPAACLRRADRLTEGRLLESPAVRAATGSVLGLFGRCHDGGLK